MRPICGIRRRHLPDLTRANPSPARPPAHRSTRRIVVESSRPSSALSTRDPRRRRRRGWPLFDQGKSVTRRSAVRKYPNRASSAGRNLPRPPSIVLLPTLPVGRLDRARHVTRSWGFGHMTRGDAAGPTAETLFAGAGESMAALRATDWSATALGPVDSWRPELVRRFGRCCTPGYRPCLVGTGSRPALQRSVSAQPRGQAPRRRRPAGRAVLARGLGCAAFGRAVHPGRAAGRRPLRRAADVLHPPELCRGDLPDVLAVRGAGRERRRAGHLRAEHRRRHRAGAQRPTAAHPA